MYTNYQHPSTKTSHNTDSAKLWDNEDLVLTALKVYGKHPRPQCFTEISRVCKLSNLRKSRYFHEKMMKNNPYEKKIRKLIAEEGEEAYPFFKIFFEEYKTKKERQKLMSYEEDKINMSYNSNSCVESNSNEECVDDQSLKEEEPYEDYHIEFEENDDNFEYASSGNNNNIINEPVTLTKSGVNQGISHSGPLIDTNAQYLENLELKLRILNNEKETMSNYFQTFSSVIDNLKAEIEQAKSNGVNVDAAGVSEEALFGMRIRKNIDNLRHASLEQVSEHFVELDRFVKQLNASALEFGREQSCLREDLKVTRNYVNVERTRLEAELNECKAQLCARNEEVRDLKRRLDDSLRQNRTVSTRSAAVVNAAGYSQSKLNEFKESFNKLTAQIQNLS